MFNFMLLVKILANLTDKCHYKITELEIEAILENNPIFPVKSLNNPVEFLWIHQSLVAFLYGPSNSDHVVIYFVIHGSFKGLQGCCSC